MANYTNFFSSNLVQASQNSGQNINLQEERSTFSWAPGDANFCMSKIINIVSATKDSTIILAPTQEQQLFDDVIIVNTTKFFITVKSSVDDVIVVLAKYDPENTSASAGYFYISGQSQSNSDWSFLSFNAGDIIEIGADVIAGAGLSTSGNGKINQVINNSYIKDLTDGIYDIQPSDLAKLLIFNDGDAVSGEVNFKLPSSSDTTVLPDGFFLYVFNVNASGVFYISPSDNDTINNNPSGKPFSLQKNTSAMIVLNINSQNTYNWFVILNSPSTSLATINSFFPCFSLQYSVSSNQYTVVPGDNAKTFVVDTGVYGNVYTITLPENSVDNLYQNGFIINIINNGFGRIQLQTSGSASINSQLNVLTTAPRINYQLVNDGNNGWFTLGVGNSCGLVNVNDSPSIVYDVTLEKFGEVFVANTAAEFTVNFQNMYAGMKYYINICAPGNPSVNVMVPTALNNQKTAMISWGSNGIGLSPVCITVDESGNYWTI